MLVKLDDQNVTEMSCWYQYYYVILMIKYHVVGLLNVKGVIKCYVDINMLITCMVG